MAVGTGFDAEDPSSVDPLIHGVVLRLSWMFPRPGTISFHLTFALIRERLVRELGAYCNIFRSLELATPSLEHLLAAGAYIYQLIPFAWSADDPLTVCTDNFARIQQVAEGRVDQLPHSETGDCAPSWVPRTEVLKAGNCEPREIDVTVETVRLLDALVGQHGYKCVESVMREAISRFWSSNQLIEVGEEHDRPTFEPPLFVPRPSHGTIPSHEVLPDTYDDPVGTRLKCLKFLSGWNREKNDMREEIDALCEEHGYLAVWGHSRDYLVERVGQSFQYDVPTKKRGKLAQFAGRRVRVICLRTGRFEKFMRIGAVG